jgi:hypothetical protein
MVNFKNNKHDPQKLHIHPVIHLFETMTRSSPTRHYRTFCLENTSNQQLPERQRGVQHLSLSRLDSIRRTRLYN